MMQQMITRFCLRLLAALVLVASAAAPVVAAVRADVDRNQVYVGDTFTLVIETNNPAAGDPDLSVLQQDFEILRTGTSSSFSMVNGRSSSLRTWRVQLRPRRIGDLEIPVLQLGGEQTKALSISVSDVPALAATPGDSPALVELSIDAEGSIYVQQQIPLTVRLYTDQRVVDGTLDPLRIADAITEPLGLERRYAVTRNGRQYRVSERRYAVAAERRGLLEIPAIDFRGKLAPPPSGSGNVQQFRVGSEPLTIDVQPPATDGDYWVPAQQLTVHDSWADRAPTLRRGEPVERVITLQATGLNGAQLPILELKEPSGARIYPGRQANDTRSDSNNLFGISRQAFTYVPGEDGRLSIPSFTVDWWNTATQKLESTKVPALTLQVLSGAIGADTVDRSDVRQQPATDASDEAGDAGVSSWWLVIIVGALLALFRFRHGVMEAWGPVKARMAASIGQVVRRAASRRTDTPPSAPVERRSVVPAAGRRPAKADVVSQERDRLESACQRKDPQEAAMALLALGRSRWPVAPPMNLHDLAERLQRGQTEIEALDRALYADARQSWDGAALWNAIGGVNWQSDSAIAKDSGRSSLPPLYPQKG